MTPQSVGASNWARAYREMDRRNAAPRTRLSPRHARIFAKAKSRGTAAWVFIKHTTDTRTRIAAGRFIRLHVLVQNIDSRCVQVDPRDVTIHWISTAKTLTNATILRTTIADTSERVTTFLGETTNLTPFDWIAFAVDVACDGCFWELDFLERVRSLDLPVHQNSSLPTNLHLPFVGPALLDTWYSILPGGCVMLQHDDLRL